tara:strand:+ start:1922 stop:2143 length:222 start_codon:yes stop_codon:yes gene_type:complete
MANKSDELRDALVETLLAAIKEQGTETPAAVLAVARGYLRDCPPEETIPTAGSGSGVLKEFLEQLPFDEDSPN